AVGLMPERHIPGQDLVFRAFNLFGENLPSMIATRQFVRMTGGWPIEDLRRAGALAASELVDQVQPYSRAIIERHRLEGLPVLLATTSPYELVAPLAEQLGLDDVLATRYEVIDGCCTGRIQ